MKRGLVAVLCLATVTACAQPLGSAAPLSAARSVTVVQVVDGDTLRVRAQGTTVRVRLLGIDSPELAHGSEPEECYAREATDMLGQLTPPGSRVQLVTDPTRGDRDRYGRLLRYVRVGEVDASRSLLRRGGAILYGDNRGLEAEARYALAERRARTQRRGLWGVCAGYS